MSCANCISGSLHEGTPIGKEIDVGGIPTYVVGDETSKRIIVFGVDIFGWRLNNLRILADEYAERGFYVLIPDLFGGYELPQWTLGARDPVNEHPSLFQRLVARPVSLFILVPFLLRYTYADQSTKITQVLTHLRKARADAKVGFVGFCWGGRYAMTLNAQFDATVVAHPSLVKFPADIAGVTKPVAFQVAETDHNFDRARGEETRRIFEKRGFADFEVVTYEGVQHGWTIRGDMSDPHKKEARDRAKEQALAWFEKYLVVDAADAPPAL